MVNQCAKRALLMILVFFIFSFELITGAPAEYETDSSIRQFPYYLDLGAINSASYFYDLDDQLIGK